VELQQVATANEVGDWNDVSYVIFIIQGRKILIDVHRVNSMLVILIKHM